MRRRRWIIGFFMLTLAVLLGATMGPGRQHSVYAQQLVPQGQALVQASAGTAFTYQGRLLSNGQPVDVACRFVFTLWDAETGGNDLATTDEVALVRDGYFTVAVDFGQDVFTGDARWMSVRLRCPEPQGEWTNLQGRIALRPVPYAMVAQSVAPGATVIDASGNSTGIYAQSGPDWILPLLIGIKTAGLWGDSRYNDGVIGTSQSGNGLYGYSETGKALYADGDAHVEGNLTWKAKTSATSLSAAAFQPVQGNLTYENIGFYLRNYGTSRETWIASVQLPQGASLKSITVCWRDGSDEDAALSLIRRSVGDGVASNEPADTLVTVTSRGSQNSIIGGCTQRDIPGALTVDNTNFAYYLALELPPQNFGNVMEFYGISIEYEVEAPY